MDGRVSSREINKTGDDEDGERNQLAGGEQVAHVRSRLHAAIVDGSDDSDQKGEDQDTRHGIFGMRPELRQIDGEEVGIGGSSGHAYQPGKPSHLNAEEATEGDAGVEIRSTGGGEARRDFGKASHDGAHAGGGSQVSPGTGAAHESSN